MDKLEKWPKSANIASNPEKEPNKPDFTYSLAMELYDKKNDKGTCY